MSSTFEVSNGFIKLSFVIKDDGRVRLYYFGNEQNFINRESTFVEIEISEGNHMGCHCSKQLQTPFGEFAKYASHKEIDNPNGKELVITTRDDVLEADTHFILYKNTSAISIYNVVRNISSKPVHLEYVSSFYLNTIGQIEGLPHDDMNIWYASNSWHVEAQWIKKSFLEAGIFNGNNAFSMKTWHLNNTGSWSTKDNLPMLGIENVRSKQFILGQIENNGSWHMEVSDISNLYYVSMCGPEMVDNQWVKKLDINEEFTSVQVTVSYGNDFEKAIQELTKARRYMVRPCEDLEELPTIFNDYMHATWDASSEELIWPLVDLASDLGIEMFVMDAGWFAKGPGWTNSIGEWVEYSENFPTNGLKGTFDYIHSKGMKAGLWFEIENMGIKCPLSEEFPDDFFFMMNGTRAIRNTRNCINFDNPKAYKWAMDLISDRIEKYGIDYIKNDYNVDTGVGNECNSDSAGDGLLKHNRAFTKWLEELMDKYPHLTIENCGSGGCRMDYQMLKLCSIQSTSDQTDYRRYPYLASNVLTACIPEQAAVWAYPVNPSIKEEITDEVVIMNMVNAMLGRIHLASYINKLKPHQIDLVKEGLRYFESIREFKKGSLPIYPSGIAYFFDKEVVGGLIKDKKIVLCVWNTSGENRDIRVDLSKYNVKSIKVGYPTNIATSYEFKDGYLTLHSDVPYQGRTFEIDLD